MGIDAKSILISCSERVEPTMLIYSSEGEMGIDAKSILMSSSERVEPINGGNNDESADARMSETLGLPVTAGEGTKSTTREGEGETVVASVWTLGVAGAMSVTAGSVDSTVELMWSSGRSGV